MILGVGLTKAAVVIAYTAGASKTFKIQSILSLPFQSPTGNELKKLLQKLIVLFKHARKKGPTLALLGSSSGRFKSAVEAIKAEAIVELAAAKSGLPVVKVGAASLKKALNCAPDQKWQARAAELFNPKGHRKDWSPGAAGAAAAALKVAGEKTNGLSPFLRT